MPSGYLFDTNSVSEARKPRPDPGVTAFLIETNFARSFISVLTLGELRKGVVDTLLAATALPHDLALVTWNVRDVVAMGCSGHQPVATLVTGSRPFLISANGFLPGALG